MSFFEKCWIFVRPQAANLITIARFIISVIGILIFASNINLVFIFVAIGLIGDKLDGWIARKLQIVSNLGKWLDQFTDKVIFHLAIGKFFLVFLPVSLFDYVFIVLFTVMFVFDFISICLHSYYGTGAIDWGKRKFVVHCVILFILGLNELFIYNQWYHFNNSIVISLAIIGYLIAIFYASRSLIDRIEPLWRKNFA